MNVLLWVLQVLLAAFFLFAGATKLVQPIDALAAQMEWVSALPAWLVRFIGAVEVLGAIGLILPAITRVLPWLTALAAAGLAFDMLLATIFHATRSEFSNMLITIVLLALSAFVAYGRWRLMPVQPGGGRERLMGRPA